MMAVAAAAIVAASVGRIAQAISYLDDGIGEGDDVQLSVPYSEFEREARDGDLLLTSSTEITSMTRMVTSSLWSHTGMVYRVGDVICEWSAHNESEEIGNTIGIPSGGPQLVPVENLVAVSGTVFWRPALALSDAQRAGVGSVVRQLAYKLRFSDSIEFLAYAGWPFSKIFAGYGGGMACPHVVAATYAAIGALDLDRNLALYTPESFSESGDALWKPRDLFGGIRMVVGYDATRLIRLPRLSKK
jgi:hypothetical protein